MRMQTKERILQLVEKYHKEKFAKSKFIAGKTYIPPAGAVFDDSEIKSLVSAALDMKWVEGELSQKLERELAMLLGTRAVNLCNSGSSANLLAFMALTSNKFKSRAIQAGDEVITTAVGFPTTVNPIFYAGAVPVFIDINIPSYNASPHLVSDAITSKTKAIVLAHTLGNPFNAEAIREIAKQNDLWLIEDVCDGLMGSYDGKILGSFGDVATLSFYPAHHMALGEGGAVYTSSPMISAVVKSFRDWGRGCWCLPACDNSCGKRFEWKLGDLPEGYDHKYTYSEIGFNLKSTDLQASIGLEQVKKVPEFVKRRRENWEYLRNSLNDLEDTFILPEPTTNSVPSWFGFALTVRDPKRIDRTKMTRWLEDNKVGTRNLFGGNLTRHPAYIGKNFRVHDGLHKSDIVTERTFWIGVHPNITTEMLDYMTDRVFEYVKIKNNSNC